MKTAFKECVFFDGEIIFNEGDAGDQAFLVQSGKVLLTKLDVNDKEIGIAQIGTHSLFGEMSIIDQSVRMATARAVGKTILMGIDKLVFDQKLKAVEPDIRKLFEMLLQYIRFTLPYEERRKRENPVQETKLDELARQSLQSPAVKKVNELEDLFMVAMFETLMGYAARRLPPQPTP